MNTKKTIFGLFVAIGASVLFTTAAYAQESKNIVEIAQETEDLSTLVTAVSTAGLVEALSDEDAELTVFAPTNDAFAALPEGTLDDLLKEENRDQLTDILTYHVVDSKVMSGDLKDGQVVTALNGDELTVTIEGDKVMINDAEVVTADVEASNGVVHIIDAVLIPEGEVQGAHSTADTGIVSTANSIALIVLALIGVAGIGLVAYEYRGK